VVITRAWTVRWGDRFPRCGRRVVQAAGTPGGLSQYQTHHNQHRPRRSLHGARAAETVARTGRPRPAPRPKTGSYRWPDQRISPGRITWTRFSARTGHTGRLPGFTRSAIDQHRIVTTQVLRQVPRPETTSVRPAATTSTTPLEVCCKSSPRGFRCHVVRQAGDPRRTSRLPRADLSGAGQSARTLRDRDRARST
jgi:hypothetical protein